MAKQSSGNAGGLKRRSFLKTAAALPAGLAAAQSAESAQDQMPMIELGPYRVSRLIAGSNTVNGGSHLSRFVDLEMRSYFTKERILWFLKRLTEAGINVWQGSGRNYKLWAEFKEQGGKILFLSLAHSDPNYPIQVEQAARLGVTGLVHHGEVTDRLFKSGKIEKAREFLKRVRDAGLLVGLSTHMPAVVEYVEEKGWDVDFYMTCVYERHRSREELKKLLGHVPIRVGEVYLEDDPPRMYKVIRATSKPCLAFKILAAGRLCQSKRQVERAFAETLKNIKPTDGVIVGMWPKWSDQIAEDVAFVKRYSKTAESGKA